MLNRLTIRPGGLLATIIGTQATSFPVGLHRGGIDGGPVYAGGSDTSKVDKTQFTLVDPTPDADLRPFSPDRPTKISSPFTVDAGRLQIDHQIYGGVAHRF